MSESGGVQEYLQNVSRKITTFMRRGDAFIQNIPKLIRDTQAGLLAPEVLAALEHKWEQHRDSLTEKEQQQMKLSPAQKALSTFGHALWNSAGFLYVD